MKQFYQSLFIAICLMFTTVLAQAQQTRGTIKGKVLTSDNKPADNITVGLKGTRFGTITTENGEYNFKAAAGSYTLVVSSVGVQGVEVQITVTAGQTTNVQPLSINTSMSELEAVNVTGNKVNKMATRKSPYVSKMPLNNLENPQVYTTISKELLVEQINTNFNDALRNTSGLDKLWSSTGRAGDGAAYYSLRGFTIQPTLINGIAGLTNGDLDPANIEKIEVIKGPSGTLFGGALTNFGGLINIATKRPKEEFGGDVSYTTGNYSLSRLTADVYGALSKDKKLLGRVNAAYNYQGSFQDAGFRKSFFLAPSLEYRATDKLTLNLDAEIYNYEGTNPLMVFLNRSRQLIARTPDELNMNFKRSFTGNDITVKTPVVNVRGLATYRISDEWTSQTSFSRSNRKTDGINQYVMFLGANDIDLSRLASYQNSTSTAIDIQQNFTGDFKIGGLRNRLVVGLDYLNQITDNNNSPYILYDVQNATINAPQYVGFNRPMFMNRLGASTAAYTKNYTVNNVYSVYASDMLNVTDRLMAMLSLRVDRFDNRGTYTQSTGLITGDYKQTAVSPKFGLVYQLVKDQVSIFGNYMNGFRNVAPVTQPLPDVSGTFKPQQANQIEGGVKVDAFKNRLTFTASYYDISVDNITRTEPVVRDGVTYNVTIQDGTQKSKGFELDLIANPVAGLNIVTGYSHNNSKLTKADINVVGRRPVSAGPADLVNAWISYTLPSGKYSGLGAGFGGNYASKNIITNDLRTGEFTLPSYTLLNGTVFYSAKKYRIGLKMDNLTNKKYFKGWTTVEPQMPRTFAANVTFKF
ncbi:TonB-dependent receptor [Mucilaginibacter terrae]|uniref:Iron complex outermembrane receptor protein n=1 Tax=Mucilaginibacter terrae TaxID=1955052 RepID=A0ABU3GVC3_9SPHI|nr:TonB-dependent receptor [Mucilaginibacter terrae]MDT3403719.1 iron complex outermembrane receptor protein [Mucilaginibacter terrae]